MGPNAVVNAWQLCTHVVVSVLRGLGLGCLCLYRQGSKDISRPRMQSINVLLVIGMRQDGWSSVVWLVKFSDVLANAGLFVQMLAMDPLRLQSVALGFCC